MKREHCNRLSEWYTARYLTIDCQVALGKVHNLFKTSKSRCKQSDSFIAISWRKSILALIQSKKAKKNWMVTIILQSIEDAQLVHVALALK